MNKAKIKELYEKAYVVYEVPYESSVVDPTIVSIHKHKVWDPDLFAELIVRMCADYADMAYDARCKYVGDYVAEAMGYGEEEGITAWRAK
jgi:hypothetical protein